MDERKAKLRELMRQTAASRGTEQKGGINNPFAQPLSGGQYLCTLCNTTVKSDLHWPAHVNGKTHKENLAKKQAKQARSQSSGAQGVAQVPSAPAPSAMIHEIQAEAQKSTAASSASAAPVSALPAGFFDDPAAASVAPVAADRTAPAAATAPVAVPAASTGALPAGFFDDRARDREAQPEAVAEEWNAFEREVVGAAQAQLEEEAALAPEEAVLREVTATGRTVQEEEEEADRREVEEVLEHLEYVKRVDTLEDRAAAFRQQLAARQQQTKRPGADVVVSASKRPETAGSTATSDSSSDDDSELSSDEEAAIGLFDWRSKRI